MAKLARYRDMYASLSKMTEAEIVSAIDEELASARRIEMLRRLLQRFNKLRGSRVRNQVITAAAAANGKRLDVDALLDRHG
ncbi:MAG TPA: hypothetical protein VMH41_16135 [Mycobacteriales bacterium]|nr:hypothetical protein [Mycobacteriales bacterium]